MRTQYSQVWVRVPECVDNLADIIILASAMCKVGEEEQAGNDTRASKHRASFYRRKLGR